MKFADKLNVLMRKKRLKGLDIAAACGVTASCVSWWRQGRSYPRSIELYRLAQLLGVTMEYLIKEDV